MKTKTLLPVIAAVSLIVSIVAGCEVSIPRGALNKVTTTKAPLISHAHYGHALTAWFDTPDQKGLFVVAEDTAERIAESAVLLNEEYDNLSETQKSDSYRKINNLIGSLDDSDEEGYTFLRALNEAGRHMEFAATVSDASTNMQGGSADFQRNMQAITIRADLLRDLTSTGIRSTSQDSKQATRQMRILAVQLLEGDDLDGDGVVGNTAEEYGLRQLRADLAQVAAAETPRYQPVPKKFLFGLIRLPDGSWKFDDPKQTNRYGRYSY